MKRILVWDLPTRVFHWSLALSFAGAWLSSESDTRLALHVFLGYLMLGLVGFRVVWGLRGTRYARFSSFRTSPRATWNYLRQTLRGEAERHLGHNPAGSLAIYLLLALAVVVGLTGYFALGGEEQQGGASALLSIAQGRIAKKLHEASATLMLLVVAGHLLGVLVESWLHRENLARAMLTGLKHSEGDAPGVAPSRGTAGLMLLAMAGFALWWFFYALQQPLEQGLGRPLASASQPQVKFIGRPLADNPQWREECGSCHLAFHPSLLPARSWQRLLDTQDQHFGSDLALDEATVAALRSFMTASAAEGEATEAAFKINRSIPAAEVPLRITETPYWVKKHRALTPADWALPAVKSKANCAGCHSDAEAGSFEDAAMKVPRP